MAEPVTENLTNSFLIISLISFKAPKKPWIFVKIALMP